MNFFVEYQLLYFITYIDRINSYLNFRIAKSSVIFPRERRGGFCSGLDCLLSYISTMSLSIFLKSLWTCSEIISFISCSNSRRFIRCPILSNWNKNSFLISILFSSCHGPHVSLSLTVLPADCLGSGLSGISAELLLMSLVRPVGSCTSVFGISVVCGSG